MNFFENLSKEVKITMAAVVCLMAFGGTLWKGHDYMEKYALADELKQTNKRLDIKIMSDLLNQVQERIWRVEDRIEGRKPTPLEKEELRNLKQQKEDLTKELGKK